MNKKEHYHLVGVAGVGMSALAQAIQSRGHDVSGSDRYLDAGEDMEVIRKLRSGGVRLFPQDGSGITSATSAVVVSTAIEKDNPDILAATKLNIPIIHRARMLANLVEGKRCVAVTGTSGKSTVTGMIGWILEQLGADPTVVNGAVVLNWRTKERIGNVRCGKSDLWVIEADESDKSLLEFHPDWGVITNVSLDHFAVEEVTKLFNTFSRQVTTGLVTALGEDFEKGRAAQPCAAVAAAGHGCPALPLPETYVVLQLNDLKGFSPEVTATGSSFVHGKVRFKVPLPGGHNAENALFAVVLCERLGFGLRQISKALSSFKGIHRRLETVGTSRGVTVIDDYAHNPAKIRAAWQAVAPHFKRVFAVWRPHGFGPLSLMMNDLADVFAYICKQADFLYLLPVYDAGGTADRSVKSEMLVEKLRARNTPAVCVSDPDKLAAEIAGAVQPGDVVLTIGARDPGLPALARKIYSAISDT